MVESADVSASEESDSNDEEQEHTDTENGDIHIPCNFSSEQAPKWEEAYRTHKATDDRAATLALPTVEYDPILHRGEANKAYRASRKKL